MDKSIFEFLNGDLSDEEERRVLHRIADNPDGRALLKLELQLSEALSEEHDMPVPQGFADRTMAAIAEMENAARSRDRRKKLWGILKSVTDWIRTPQPLNVRPAYGLALLLTAALGILLSYGPGDQPLQHVRNGSVVTEPPHNGGVTTPVSHDDVPQRVPTRFVYVDNEASSVAVAGDFTGWNPRPMHAETVNGHRVWSATMALPQGEHQYMFVIDGNKWVTDPLAPIQRDDGFGNKNAVITL